MARSRSRGRAPRPARSAPPDPHSSPPGFGPAPVLTLASATLPRVWQGVGYRPLPDAVAARPLFEFAAVPCPEGDNVAFVWGAFRVDGATERLIGAIAAERSGTALLLHGPVVLPGAAPGDEPLEVAVQLVAAALDHAAAAGGVTVFARPLGLDRVWVRFGFIPVPEGALPAALAGRSGAGLYGWRGGTALWTFRESTGSLPG